MKRIAILGAIGLTGCMAVQDGPVPVGAFDGPPNITVKLNDNFGACMGTRPMGLAPGQGWRGTLEFCNLDADYEVSYRTAPTRAGERADGLVFGERIPPGLYPQITVTSNLRSWVFRTPVP